MIRAGMVVLAGALFAAAAVAQTPTSPQAPATPVAPATGRLGQKRRSDTPAGGVLVLGKAERPTGTRRLALLGPGVYRRSRG